MNGKTKIWLIVAAALILIGTVIFGGAMMALKWDFTKLSTSKLETSEYEIAEGYENISIVTDTADITFVASDGAATTVVCREWENSKHSVTVKDGTLTIELIDTRKWHEYIGITFGAPKITVYLPEGAYGTLNVNESTGDIVIPEGFSFDSINARTSTGDIKIDGISAASLDLSVTTGKITASGVTCSGDVTLKVSTGKTLLKNVTCQNLTSTGDTGKIVLTNVYVENNMDVERSTGDVTFENADAASISVKTDTGDVRGTLHTPKTFYVATDTGKVSVPKTSGGICEITTDTGDIIIELATY